MQSNTVASQLNPNCDFDLNIKEEVTVNDGGMFIGRNPLPPLPIGGKLYALNERDKDWFYQASILMLAGTQ